MVVGRPLRRTPRTGGTAAVAGPVAWTADATTRAERRAPGGRGCRPSPPRRLVRCGAEPSMTESPIAVTCLPVISGDAERPGLGVAPAGAGAWPGACAWPGAGFAGLAALLWALGDRVAALTLSPCATCRISPEVLL